MDTKPARLFTHHTLNDKERKNLTILELIRKSGAISRTDISKTADINIVSISNYVKNYIDKKLILEKGFDVSSGGRRPELVELNRRENYFLGVDVNSVGLIAAMTDIAIASVGKVKTPKPKGTAKDLAGGIIESVNRLIDTSGVEKAKIRAIGIGASGNNLLQIADEVEKTFGVETFIGSDAACAALAEKRLNPQADVEDLLYMYSDVGCGIIVKGDIYFGAGGSAGEMVSFNERISKDEENAFFRDSQYLRPWCIDLGIIQSAKREIAKGVGTKIVALADGNIENVTKQVVIEAARQNDEIALDILKSAGLNLGIRTAYLVNLFDPGAVVIGGSIEKAGELILEPIRSAVKKFTFNRKSDLVKIIPSVLGEDAVSLGAAALAIREIFLRA